MIEYMNIYSFCLLLNNGDFYQIKDTVASHTYCHQPVSTAAMLPAYSPPKITQARRGTPDQCVHTSPE